MKKSKKLSILMIMVLTLSLILSGCGGKKIENASDKKDEAGKDSVKIGLVVGTGGLGDQNFNDMAYEGLKQAKKEHDNISIDYSEPQSVSDYETLITQYAEDGSYDLIIISSNEAHTALEKVADEFPKQNFSIVDTYVDKPNVKSILKDFSQMTFLNGFAAGKMTSDTSLENMNDKKDVGIVIGMDIPNMQEAVLGFTAGAKLADPEVNVRVGDVNSFSDPVKAKEITKSMYDNGADIVLNFSGGSGLGVINQAKESKLYAMGGASNQNPDAPELVIASAIEDLTGKTKQEAIDIIEKNWEPGKDIGSLADDYVGITFEGTKVKVSEELLKEIEELKTKVAKGDIILPKNIKEVDAWAKDLQK